MSMAPTKVDLGMGTPVMVFPREDGGVMLVQGSSFVRLFREEAARVAAVLAQAAEDEPQPA